MILKLKLILNKVRRQMEALRAMPQDTTDKWKLWNCYLDFEIALYKTLQILEKRRNEICNNGFCDEPALYKKYCALFHLNENNMQNATHFNTLMIIAGRAA